MSYDVMSYNVMSYNVNSYLCVNVVTISLRNENALFIEFALIIIYSYIQYKRILCSTYDQSIPQKLLKVTFHILLLVIE